MRNLHESAEALRELLSQRILVLDGAMGTMLQQRDVSAADFGGPALEGCNENLVRTRPDVVLDIHRKYLEAGADIIETNSFGGTPIVLAEYAIEAIGSMLAGQTIEAMWASLKYAKPLAFGMNCATGPEFMTDHIRTLSQLTSEFVSCYPNAGLPDEEGKYLETPTSLAAQLEKFVDHGWLNLVGGCCGTNEQHIRAIAQMAQGKKPRQQPAESHRAIYTGIEAIEAEESTRPLLVGERTNVIGSRLFKNLVAEEKWEEATEIARRQVRGGPQIT